MTWILIALIPPLLYAISNHTDKYLIEKYFKGGEVGAFIIFSAVFSIIIVPFIYFFKPEVLFIGLSSALILLLNGCLIVGSLICYFYAMREEEASVVIPFYQTIPIFGYILGYFILGETLSWSQIVASLVIILGASILAFEIEEEGGYRFKKRVVFLMLAASLLYALNGVIFKLFALDLGFWTSIFWEQNGKVLLGILILTFIESYRKQVVEVFRLNKASILFFNILNEGATLSADLICAFAYLLAPITLVMAVNSAQPFFVLVIGIILTLLFPKTFKESLAKKHLVQKIVAIGLIIMGGVLLSLITS